MYEVKDVSSSTDSRLYARRPVAPMGVVVHTTDGKDSLRWLQGQSIVGGKPASSDVLVQRDGAIYRIVPKWAHSYHAGVCMYNGKVDRQDLVSKLYLGVEIENYDRSGQTPTQDQHKAVAGLILEWAWEYDWTPVRVYGHYALAYPMGRRSDPHQWDWGYMFWLMAHAQDEIRLHGDKP